LLRIVEKEPTGIVKVLLQPDAGGSEVSGRRPASPRRRVTGIWTTTSQLRRAVHTGCADPKGRAASWCRAFA